MKNENGEEEFYDTATDLQHLAFLSFLVFMLLLIGGVVLQVAGFFDWLDAF
jgi:hypothetical protein